MSQYHVSNHFQKIKKSYNPYEDISHCSFHYVMIGGLKEEDPLQPNRKSSFLKYNNLDQSQLHQKSKYISQNFGFVIFWLKLFRRNLLYNKFSDYLNLTIDEN